MTKLSSPPKPDVADAANEAADLFKRSLGISRLSWRLARAGNRQFLKFEVGRSAPVYEYAIRQTQRQLGDDHRFKGLISLAVEPVDRFPQSLEADVLGSLLTRNTRQVVSDHSNDEFQVSYVPFQNQEDGKLSQAATHILVGRRGVGKSTLISRVAEILEKSRNACVVLDMQAYSEGTSEELIFDVLGDLSERLRQQCERKFPKLKGTQVSNDLKLFSSDCLQGAIEVSGIAPRFRRIIESISQAIDGDVFVFLDDFHVVEQSLQPRLLQVIHGSLKGARGWLKVSGLKSLLNAYDPTHRFGLQVPGDAQMISLDLTLVDPESAETHLQAILAKFLEAVGVPTPGTVVPENVLRRLIWANAGVPRDFLQMFGRSLEHARRSNRPKVTLTDANLAIGEFGQQKIDEMERDGRNANAELRRAVTFLEEFCLDRNKVNAFLIRSENTPERSVVQILSDLRIVHLIHPTITPHRAGERYEAFLLDYCLFTGFRLRPNIKEMLPEDNRQFKATELRKIPALPKDFLKSGNGAA